mgnify:CR=1 FL=1|tara:strand:+ start:389 stop:781 length:393 start_codon:yes stop_codon:yes gene_type:complete
MGNKTKTSFKLRSGNSTPFKMMGSSPLKNPVGGAWNVLKGAGKLLYGGMIADDIVSDKTKNKSTVEKILRTVDEWGPTMGIFSKGYDNVKSGKAEIPKGYYQKGGEGYKKTDYSKKTRDYSGKKTTSSKG